MANPAAEIRARVLAAHPEAVVVERGRGHMKHQIANAPNGQRRYVLDAVVGSLHYQTPAKEWREIDTALADDGFDGFLACTGEVGYLLRVADNGRRRFYPDKYDLTRYVEFGTALGLKKAARQTEGVVWDSPHVRVEVWTGPTRAKLLITLKTPQAPTGVAFPMILVGLTLDGNTLLADGQPVGELVFPPAVDAEGTERPLDVSFGAGSVSISLDTAGLVFPIIVDPTVDKQVAAGGDDAYVSVSTEIFVSGIQALQGCATGNPCHAFYRWTGVSIEGTIGVSYIQCFSHFQAGTAQLKVYGVDEDNPPAPTTYAEFMADPLTTAGVDWDGTWTDEAWNQSPSLNSIFQELVNSYTISNDAVMVQVRDDLASGSHYNYARTYEYNDNLHGAKLHVEYSTGGEPQTISPSAIASAEAFGSAGLGLSLAPSGIASAEAFGTDKLNLHLAPSAIASAEAFGSPALHFHLLPTGIVTAEALGSPALHLCLFPAGIASAEVLGALTLIMDQFIEPTGIASAEALGSPLFGFSLAPTGIPSAEALGSPQLNLLLILVGIASAEAIGALTLMMDQFIEPTGIVSAEALGSPMVTRYSLWPSGWVTTPTRARASATHRAAGRATRDVTSRATVSRDTSGQGSVEGP